MLKFLIIFIMFWVSLSTQTEQQHKSNDDLKDKFEQFIKEYNRQYKDDNEKALRYSHFVDNLRKADELNRLYQEDQFGVTKFSDWSEAEQKKLFGRKPALIGSHADLVPLQKFNQGPAPDAYDWRQHNVVTPVKNQGNCSGCWAFSTIGNIEGQYALKHHKLLSLSEQQVIDCVTPKTNEQGCDGGLQDVAMNYLAISGMLVESESAYPYKAKQNKCNYNKQEGVVKVIGLNFLNATTEDELKQNLYEYGPLSFGMNGVPLLSWHGKIFPGCFVNEYVGHALVLVGYGTSDSGEDYWIVKNSWGTDWNHGGYFNMKRGVNACKILDPYNFWCSQVA